MTIKDIARISGCSVSTISRVINDRPDVRPETKEHVLKVMRCLLWLWQTLMEILDSTQAPILAMR